MKRLKCDMVIYVCFLAVSLLFWFVFIPQQIVLRGSWSGDIVFTSRTFPYILFAALGIASVAGILQTLYRMKTAVKEQVGQETMKWKSLLIPAGFFALTGLYAWMFSAWGYIVSTAVIVPVYLAALTCRKWQYYLVTYGFAAVVYVVFKYLLNIPL